MRLTLAWAVATFFVFFSQAYAGIRIEPYLKNSRGVGQQKITYVNSDEKNTLFKRTYTNVGQGLGLRISWVNKIFGLGIDSEYTHHTHTWDYSDSTEEDLHKGIEVKKTHTYFGLYADYFLTSLASFRATISPYVIMRQIDSYSEGASFSGMAYTASVVLNLFYSF